MNATDKEIKRILDHLNRLVSGRLFRIEDLETLTTADLKEDSPVQDIAIEIIQDVLEQFRSDYKSRIFKDSDH